VALGRFHLIVYRLMENMPGVIDLYPKRDTFGLVVPKNHIVILGTKVYGGRPSGG